MTAMTKYGRLSSMLDPEADQCKMAMNKPEGFDVE